MGLGVHWLQSGKFSASLRRGQNGNFIGASIERFKDHLIENQS